MNTYSRQYISFRNNIPQKKICVGGDVTWTIYDTGQTHCKSPLILLPCLLAQADLFFLQLLSLRHHGCRAIAIEYPVSWSIKQFCHQFHLLLHSLKLNKIHLFGAGLGGFLALKFAEYSRNSLRVASVILSNSFTDSSLFTPSILPSNLLWLLPGVVLRRMMKKMMNDDGVHQEAINFINISLNNLTQAELSSRLTLNSCGEYVQPQYLKHVQVMIIETQDMTGTKTSNETSKCFPTARRADLKGVGEFAFFTKAAHVNLFIMIHMKQFFNTTFSPLNSQNSFQQSKEDKLQQSKEGKLQQQLNF